MEKIKLKGGSLSGTYLINDNNNFSFVRKEVSLSENREYGFQRWYSQLKRMQRYSILFPDLFPKILKYGMNGNMAYFDMEFIKNSITAHEFLITTSDKEKIEKFTESLIRKMKMLHKEEIPSNEESMELYVNEEIELRLEHCLSNKFFKNFLNYDTIIFNGEKIPSLKYKMNEYKKNILIYKNPTETFSHGNLTLENILYVPEENRIIFIDPYEENIIDSNLADYSQLLQSCNSKYELYNNGNATINGNSVTMEIHEFIGLNIFHEKIIKFLNNSISHDKYLTVQLLEISQYIRMLPFKMAVDESKMIFFYSLASKLFNDFIKKNSSNNV